MSDTALADLAGAAEPAAEETEAVAGAWSFADEPDVTDPGLDDQDDAAAVASEPPAVLELGAPEELPAEPPAPPERPHEPEPVEATVPIEPQPAPEPVREPAAPPPGPAEQRPARSDAGLMTETMALLYRSQGFHDRAAEVYRALLRTRPDDERLRARLREAEEAAAGPAPAPSAAPADEESGEVWLRGVGAPWNAGESEPPVDATPYAWTEPDDADQGEAIGTYLQDLVSWKPGLGRWADQAVESQPRTMDATPAPAWSQAPEPVAEREPEPSEEWSQAAVEELSSWEPPSETAAAEMPADPWLQGLSDAGDETPPLAQDGWTPLELEPHMEVAPEQMPANAPPPLQPQMERDEDEEDEDLEMFRSWLQSLKK